MAIKGLDNISAEQLSQEIKRGGKFVYFEFCVSVLILTFKRTSNIYYLRPGESPLGKSIPFTMISLIAGWWGFPWGPIYTIASLATNFGGGKDVTGNIIAAMNANSDPVAL